MSENNIKQMFVYILLFFGILLLVLPYIMFEELTGTFELIGIFLLAIAIGLYLRFKDDNTSKVKKLADEVKFKYQLDDIYVSNDLSGIIGISNEKKILYLMSRMDLTTGLDLLSDQFVVNALPFKNIMKINIIENDNVIVKSTDGDLVGKSVIGGFGNDGTHKKNMIQKVRIQAITDDVLKPSVDVFLYNSNFGFKRDSDEYNDFYNTINKWLNHIKSIEK